MNQGCFPRDSGSRQGFYSRAGSHHLLQLQPLPKPRVTLGKCLEPSGKTRLCPHPKGKQNNGIVLGPSTTPGHSQGSSPGRWGHSRCHRWLQIQEPAAVLPPSLLQAGNQAQEVFCGTRFKQGHLCWLGGELFIPGFFLGLGLRTWFLLAAWKELDVFCPNSPRGPGLIPTIFGGTESQVQHNPSVPPEGWRQRGGRGSLSYPKTSCFDSIPFQKNGKKLQHQRNRPWASKVLFSFLCGSQPLRVCTEPSFCFLGIFNFPSTSIPVPRHRWSSQQEEFQSQEGFGALQPQG